jgi:hypothetical protein
MSTRFRVRKSRALLRMIEMYTQTSNMRCVVAVRSAEIENCFIFRCNALIFGAICKCQGHVDWLGRVFKWLWRYGEYIFSFNSNARLLWLGRTRWNSVAVCDILKIALPHAYPSHASTHRVGCNRSLNKIEALGVNYLPILTIHFDLSIGIETNIFWGDARTFALYYTSNA